MPRWFHPEEEVKAILTDTLNRIKPELAVWDILATTQFIWTNGSLPSDVAETLTKSDVTMINAGINTLINCGCSGARANLTQALKLFNSVATVTALADGAKLMYDNAKVKLQQFTITRIAKKD
jgi:hypothetical protein